MSTYYATKAYVKSLPLDIAEEIKDYPIHICCLCPGPVKTEFDKITNVQFSLKAITAKQCEKYTLKQLQRKKLFLNFI